MQNSAPNSKKCSKGAQRNRERPISEFQTPSFKTRLSAKNFLTENEFYLHENKNYNFHINGVALSLALKQA